jgi:hypothetical protein
MDRSSTTLTTVTPSQFQASVMFAGFGGVDGLTGNAEFLGKIALAPVTFR